MQTQNFIPVHYHSKPKKIKAKPVAAVPAAPPKPAAASA
jgi:hypothetical protein